MDKHGKILQTIPPYLVLLASLAMTTYGICRGEMATVLNKAVNICLECIGLG